MTNLLRYKYDLSIQDFVVKEHLSKLLNQIYKLLPMREESIEWKKPLSTIIEEFVGMERLLIDQQDILFPLLCKLEGMYKLDEPDDFALYRRTIFECIGLIDTLIKQCKD